MTTTDCIIVGGGIAGLQAAIQLGRYSTHSVLVIDAGQGRSTLCRKYHNILGWPDGVSGDELRALGKKQAESTGVRFKQDRILAVKRLNSGVLQLSGESGQTYDCRTLLLATGVVDRIPDIPGLMPTLGISVYICPDCDGYEIEGKNTVLMGGGDDGANLALVLVERTNQLVYVNHDRSTVTMKLMDKLNKAGVRYIEAAITEVLHKSDGYIQQVKLDNGETLQAERGFLGFGQAKVQYELAEQLGVKLNKDKYVETNPRSKQTNLDNVWAAGDIGIHAEQVTVAMGEGSLAAIWIHKTLTGSAIQPLNS